ncbi:MAG TPA: ABC-type transport auxiliary lipoprotein family protein [Rhizomicrobium sp.]|nr:ABC-type transport auxiliary lipoprotein family protein [Rhizomicrobium sp.]
MSNRLLAPILAAFVLTAFVLAACGAIGPGPAPQLYVLKPQLGALADAPQVNWQLAVATPQAQDSLDSHRIALMQGPVTMDYYANAAWTDSAPLVVQGLLLEALEKSGKISGVSRDTEGLNADYVLQTDLKDFSAHYDVADGIPTVTVHIVAKLLAKDRTIVASLDSNHTAQASANSVPAVVLAFDEALGASLEEIAGWALRAPRVATEPVSATPEPVPPAERHYRRHRQ